MTHSRPRAARGAAATFAIVAAAVAFAIIGSTATPAYAYDHPPQDPDFPEVSSPQYTVWDAEYRDYGNGVRIQEGLYDTRGISYREFNNDNGAYCPPGESRLFVESSDVYRYYRGLVSSQPSEGAPAAPLQLALEFDSIPGDSYVVRFVGAPQELGWQWSLADVAAELKIAVDGVQIGSAVSQLPPPNNYTTVEASFVATSPVTRIELSSESIGASGQNGYIVGLQVVGTAQQPCGEPAPPDPLPVSIVSPTVAVPAAIGLASLLTLGLAFVGVRHLRRTRTQSIQ